MSNFTTVVDLTEVCMDAAFQRNRDCIFGVYRLNDVTLVYRLNDFYFIGWLVAGVFYGDKRELNENEELKKALKIKEVKCVGFEFKYDYLPMNKVKTRWVEVMKLLKSPNDVKCAVASIIVLTSESWRFYPIAKACENANYTLCLHDSVKSYVNGLSQAVQAFDYTLRHLLNDWSKLSDRMPIIVGGKTIPFTENDIKKILKMPKVSKY